MTMTPPSIHCHPLLRGSRWRLARARSRALWTSVTQVELAERFDDAGLRAGVEGFLRLVAGVVEDVETLLIFDHECAELSVAVSLRPERGTACAWEWIGQSRAGASARRTPDQVAAR